MNSFLSGILIFTPLIIGVSYLTGFTQPNQPKIKIVVSGWASSAQEKEELDRRIHLFNLSQSRIQAVYDPVPLTDYYNETIFSRHKNKTAADIFYVRDADLNTYLRSGILLPLNQFLEKNNPGYDDFHEESIKIFRQPDGTIPVVPKDFNYIGLIVNEDWRQAAHLPSTGPKTVDEWADWLEKLILQKKSRRVPEASLIFSGHDFELAAIMASVNNTDDKSDRLSMVGNAFTRVSWWASNDWLKTDFNVSESNRAFSEERVGSLLEGIWFFPYYQTNFQNLNFRIYPLPAASGNKLPCLIITTVGWGIYSETKHPAEAWEVLKYLVSDFSYDKWLTESVAYPPLKKHLQEIIDGKESRFGARELLTMPTERVPLITWTADELNIISRELRTMLLFRRYPGDSRDVVDYLLRKREVQ